MRFSIQTSRLNVIWTHVEGKGWWKNKQSKNDFLIIPVVIASTKFHIFMRKTKYFVAISLRVLVRKWNLLKYKFLNTQSRSNLYPINHPLLRLFSAAAHSLPNVRVWMHKRQIIHVHKTNEIYYAFYYISLAHFSFLMLVVKLCLSRQKWKYTFTWSEY